MERESKAEVSDHRASAGTGLGAVSGKRSEAEMGKILGAPFGTKSMNVRDGGWNWLVTVNKSWSHLGYRKENCASATNKGAVEGGDGGEEDL